MNLDCTLKYLEITYYVFAIIGFASIIWGFFSYIVTKKQLYGATMSRCIDIYRDKFVPMILNAENNQAFDYIDFVNEELFYFEKKFIPKDVMFEWIDGMLNYVPIFKNQKIVNPENCLQELKKNDLYDYPRVRKVFDIKNDYTFVLLYSNKYEERHKRRAERDKLIKEIISNIRK